MSVRPTTVVVASPLEDEHVGYIRSSLGSTATVIHEPGLLPLPRYAGDHHGIPRRLDEDAQARWLSLLDQAEVLFDFDWLAPGDLPKNAPRLRWVQATSSGIGEYMAETGLDDTDIAVTTAAGIHGGPLAEFVLFGLLYFLKDGPGLAEAKGARRWERHTTGELSGRRILLIGLGEVGQRIAGACAALGVEVWGVGRRARKVAGDGVTRLVRRSDIPSALGEVDALVLAVPYTAESHQLIGRNELSLLPPGSILVNVARGKVVDEEAMIDALRRGHLGGAALDVTSEEPLPVSSPLWTLRNVLLSPHSASTVAAENRRIVELFLRNFGRFRRGEPLINLYERSRGY